MATSIVDAHVITVQSPFLDQLARDSRTYDSAAPCEVIDHHEGGTVTRSVVSVPASKRADWRLRQVHHQADGSTRLFWVANRNHQRDALKFAGEGFEFSAERAGRTWRLALPMTAPADVADLLCQA